MKTKTRTLIKRFLRKNFPGFVKILNQMYNQLHHMHFYGKKRAKVFSIIYNKNHWRNEESSSGPGSTIQKTESVRKALAKIFVEFKIDSILDVPCGDFNWMRQVDLSGLKYLGIDIVPDIIENNIKLYLEENITFQTADLSCDKLPCVDLIFCRDCFVHLSYSDIRKAIKNIKDSGSKYLMSTTFVRHNNFDIVTGNWRQLNMQTSPFNFPTPIHLFKEDDLGENEDKSIALWRIEDIPDLK